MVEWVRTHCLLFPHVTENVQWENSLLLKVGGKMFALLSLEPDATVFAFKCSPEKFSELVETPGIIPSPYLARAHWVAFEHENALPTRETKALLRESYELVFAKLPKKVRAELTS